MNSIVQPKVYTDQSNANNSQNKSICITKHPFFELCVKKFKSFHTDNMKTNYTKLSPLVNDIYLRL